MNDIAQVVYEHLAKGEPVVLVKIIHQRGSTPRGAGTQMVVTRDGSHVGTIGGGLMEGTMIAKSLELIDEGSACIVAFDLTQDDVAAMDMICGGDVEVLLDPIAPTQDNVALADRWCQMQRETQSGGFVTVMQRIGDRIEQIDHGVMAMDGTVYGHLPVATDRLIDVLKQTLATGAMIAVTEADHDILLEPVEIPPTAIIIGAGHVAQPTAHLAAAVGFRVIVRDDREIFAKAERFPDADQVVVLDDFETVFDGLAVHRNTFIIIVTRGHLYDKIVLAKALKTQAGYIGMIGSRRKREAIFGQLVKEGFTEEDLKRVHSPIGLNIGAETPEEIGLSIVAELVKEKRGLTK